MHFVPTTKTPKQQSCLMLHRARHLYVCLLIPMLRQTSPTAWPWGRRALPRQKLKTSQGLRFSLVRSRGFEPQTTKPQKLRAFFGLLPPGP